MARVEIDSFVLKFKNLLLSGRNATLVIKSTAGKAEVSLNVELGDVPPHLPGQHQQSRDGPSRQRRRLRRAETRKAYMTEDVIETATEEVNAEKARTASNTEEVIKTIVEEIDAEKATKVLQDSVSQNDAINHNSLKDEFCPDDTFEEKESESESTVKHVEKILVKADCQAHWNNAYVVKLVEENLKIINIRMKSIIVNRNCRKCFESCIVTIEPTRR